MSQILKALVRHFILNQCIEVGFSRLKRNMHLPKEDVREILLEIYRIYRNVRLEDDVDIGSFEDFESELMRVYLGAGEGKSVYDYVVTQLELLKAKYPGI